MSSFSNWLAQVMAVTWFSLRTLPERRGAVLAAAVGIAGVVAVFVGVLSIAAGFQRTMAATGGEHLAIVLRSSADAEMTSIFSREEARVVADAPGIARADDVALASPELSVVINLPSRKSGGDANVPFRGVEPVAFAVHENVELVAGRRFQPGRNEVIVGVGALRMLAGVHLGGTIRLGSHAWEVVGLFRAGGSVTESEIWADAAMVQGTYDRGSSFQSVIVRLASPDRFPECRDWLTSNPQLQVTVRRQAEFYAEQSRVLTTFIETVGVVIAVLMAMGALFGALNTMYSAVAARVREIATLRALGFSRGPVMVSVLVESLVIALLGGGVGALVSYLAFDGLTASTINWQSFSQVAFAFQVTPALLGGAVFLAVLLGFLGGLFPAVHAVRVPIADGLREN